MRIRISRSRVLVLSLLGLGISGPTLAVDGRIEINQTAALAGGVTPGDLPGFPVTLSQPGSYVLTGNLTLATVNTDGIEITAASGAVGIDLNRFSITGPATCTTPCPAASCTTGTGRGIYINGTPLGVGVRNGLIQGVGASGIDIQGGVKLESVALIRNGGDGLRVTGGATTLFDVTPAFNGGFGINGDTGFPVTGRDVTATCNGSTGIQGGPVSQLHGAGAFNNASHGFSVGLDSLVRDSTATVNIGYGINCGATAAYSGNVLNSNGGSGTGNQASPSCVEIGTNLCAGNTTCP